MNMSKIVPIIFVIAIAGCVGQTDGPTQADIADVLVTENQPVIPSQPTAGGSFTVRLTVENQHGTEFADGVEAYLFDSGKCKVDKINDALPVESEGPYSLLGEKPLRFAPGQQELVKMSFNAPSQQEIVGLGATCPIRYKVKYDFSAKSESSFDVISTSRLEQLETEKGERPVSERTLNIGPGPIRISVEPKTPLPAVTGSKLPIEIFVRNVGKGNIKNGAIEQEKLELTIPDDIEIDLDRETETGTLCNGKFKLVSGTEKKYTNVKEIQFVKGQTNPITCYLKAPDESKVSTERQYTISAKIDNYQYEYFGQEINVAIKP